MKKVGIKKRKEGCEGREKVFRQKGEGREEAKKKVSKKMRKKNKKRWKM